MGSHLYNSTVRKVLWFIRRFGFRELFMKPLRVLAAPIIMRFLPAKEFRFRDSHLALFYHHYNPTWAGERCVEVPIALSLLEGLSRSSVLEVGNVLSHYGHGGHTIIDKYEKGPGVTSVDIVDYRVPNRFKLIISISTFEHIGYDDEAPGGSGEKILKAIRSCINMLDQDGLLILTVPIGYNPDLDSMLQSSQLGMSRAHFLKRTGFCDWSEAEPREALESCYGSPFPYANAVAILEFVAGPEAAAQSLGCGRSEHREPHPQK